MKDGHYWVTWDHGLRQRLLVRLLRGRVLLPGLEQSHDPKHFVCWSDEIADPNPNGDVVKDLVIGAPRPPEPNVTIRREPS